MPRVGLLHRVHRQTADRVDREPLDLGCGHGSDPRGCAASAPCRAACDGASPTTTARRRGGIAAHPPGPRTPSGPGGWMPLAGVRPSAGRPAGRQPSAPARTRTSACAGAPARASAGRAGSANGDTASADGASEHPLLLACQQSHLSIPPCSFRRPHGHRPWAAAPRARLVGRIGQQRSLQRDGTSQLIVRRLQNGSRPTHSATHPLSLLFGPSFPLDHRPIPRPPNRF